MPARIRRSTSWVPAAPLRARPNARRLTASARHFSLGCSHAPLPAIRRRSSTTTADDPPAPATSRSNWDRGPFFRHPMQVRSGWFPRCCTAATTSNFLPICTCRGSGGRHGTGTAEANGHRPLGAVVSILAPSAPLPRNDAGGRRPPGPGSGAGTRPRRSYLPRLSTASETMSIRQPVSLAASRAFWPSLPMARDSW